MLNLTIDTQPASEPLTLQELKDHSRITWADEDLLLERLRKAARTHVENLTSRALITQTLERQLDAFPTNGVIILPRPPVQAITTVKYYGTDGVNTTLASSEYLLDAVAEPGRLTPAPTKSWPSTQVRTGAVQVTYTAGYGLTGDDVPEDLKWAIALKFEELYRLRGTRTTGVNVTEHPRAISDLCLPYAVVLPDLED